MKQRLLAVTGLWGGLTGRALSASIRRVQAGQSAHKVFRLRCGRRLGIGLAGLVVVVLAGCSRSWQGRGQGTGDTAEVSAVALRPSAMPTAKPAATATPALAARVNGQPILLEDYEFRLVESRAALVPQGVITATLDDEADPAGLGQRVLDDMIDSLLVLQAADELGVVPSDAEIEAHVKADILAGGGSSAFSEWLTATGQTVQGYSAEVRSSLILQRVVLAVTADVASGSEDAIMLRALAFQQWLTERRAGAIIERWIGN